MLWVNGQGARATSVGRVGILSGSQPFSFGDSAQRTSSGSGPHTRPSLPSWTCQASVFA